MYCVGSIVALQFLQSVNLLPPPPPQQRLAYIVSGKLRDSSIYEPLRWANGSG